MMGFKKFVHIIEFKVKFSPLPTPLICYRNTLSFRTSVPFGIIQRYWCGFSGTVCPGSSDPFYIVTYYIKWVTTSWTYSTV